VSAGRRPVGEDAAGGHGRGEQCGDRNGRDEAERADDTADEFLRDGFVGEDLVDRSATGGEEQQRQRRPGEPMRMPASSSPRMSTLP
jgi:hypothetical protein